MTFDLKIGNSSCVQTSTEPSGLGYCPDEIVIEIFMRCVCIEGDIQGAKAFSLTNRHIYNVIAQYMSQLDLGVVCPKLTILDAKALGCTVDDEPFITSNMKCQVMKCYQNMVPYVEGDLGLTLLTMLKGCSVRSLYKEGQALMPGNFCVDSNVLEQIGDDKVQKTYRVLITNNVFSGSRYKTSQEHRKLVSERKCELATVHEIMADCILMYKMFGRALYSQERSILGNFRGATTFGLTSTCFVDQGRSWLVFFGYDSAEDRFRLVCITANPFADKALGAGGKVNL